MNSVDSSQPIRRFHVAFSFAGEIRDYVEKVANILASRYGRDHILYDAYHRAEFARPDLAFLLAEFYREHSDLIVVVVCDNYDHKRWTGWEFQHIYGVATLENSHRLMLCRFDKATIKELSANAGYVDFDDLTPEQAADLIVQRLELNRKKERWCDELPTTQVPRQALHTAGPEMGEQMNSAPLESATSRAESLTTEPDPAWQQPQVEEEPGAAPQAAENRAPINVQPTPEEMVEIGPIVKIFVAFLVILLLSVWLWKILII